MMNGIDINKVIELDEIPQMRKGKKAPTFDSVFELPYVL